MFDKFSFILYIQYVCCKIRMYIVQLHIYVVNVICKWDNFIYMSYKVMCILHIVCCNDDLVFMLNNCILGYVYRICNNGFH